VKNRAPYLLLASVFLVLTLASCTGSQADGTGSDSAAQGEVAGPDREVDPATQFGVGKPTVNIARANWSSGHIQAEIYKMILERVGYEVSEPEAMEADANQAYEWIATGEADLWANSWFPEHDSLLDAPLPSGDARRSALTVIDGPMQTGGRQGFLAPKSVLEEYGIVSIDQINNDPALVELFDADGNGKAELFSCPPNARCSAVVDSMIAFHQWENLEQVSGGYDAMFVEFLERAQAGEPSIMYTWTPSPYLARAVPGELTMWLTMHPTDVLDASNPLGVDQGDTYAQGAGLSLGPDQCTQPCQIGWEADDIVTTLHTPWAGDNPQAVALLSQVQISVLDMSRLGLELIDSDGTQADVEALASSWMVDHSAEVDAWIRNAVGAR